jgi:hypothetical protein
MNKVTRTTKAKSASKLWISAYRLKEGWEVGDRYGEICKSLIALGDNPDPDDVDKVIGNSSYTDCHCNECDSYVDEIIMLGEEDYDSARVCKECLVKALKEL